MGNIVRPLRWNGAYHANSLAEMTDSQLEIMSWCLRKYFADRLAESHDMNSGTSPYVSWTSGRCTTGNISGNPAVGSMFVKTGGSGTSPSTDSSSYWDVAGTSMDDRRKFVARNTNPDDYGGSPDPDYASDPGEAAFDNTLAIQTKYWFQQRKVHEYNSNFQSLPSLPSDSTYNSDGYVVWNGSNSIIVDNTVADIAHTIIKHANYNMLFGDELGTYRIATSSPGTYWMPNLDWAFIDSITQFHTIPDLPVIETQWMYTGYALYLNVYTAPPGSITDTDYTNALGAPNGTSDRLDAQHSWVEMNLVKNILYPIWVQSSFADLGGYGYPRYTIQTSSSVTSSHEEIRSPAINDTSYTNSSARQQLWQGTYYHDRYGTGSTSATHSWYLKMHWPSASYLRTPG